MSNRAQMREGVSISRKAEGGARNGQGWAWVVRGVAFVAIAWIAAGLGANMVLAAQAPDIGASSPGIVAGTARARGSFHRRTNGDPADGWTDDRRAGNGGQKVIGYCLPDDSSSWCMWIDQPE